MAAEKKVPIPILDRASGMVYLLCDNRRIPLFRIGKDGQLYFLWHRGFKKEVPISIAEIEAYIQIYQGR